VTSSGSPEGGKGRPAHRWVLVVDDDREVRESLGEVLEDRGYSVLCVANGRQALDMLAAFRPDLVLLDLFMPSVNGWDVLEAMKSDRQLRRIPVIVISSSLQGRELDAAVRYVPKPFEADRLFAAMEQTLANRAGGASAPSGAGGRGEPQASARLA
jgi:CheY-like chemotaxis protein